MDLMNIKGLGNKTFEVLKKISINNLCELQTYYPYKHKILVVNNNLNQNGEYVINGFISSNVRVIYIKNNLNYLMFDVNCNNKLIKCVIFNRNFIKNNLTINKEVCLIGKYNILHNKFTATDIKFNHIKDMEIEPIYHLTNGISNKVLNKFIINSLDYPINDYIPRYICEKYQFKEKKDCITEMNIPSDLENLKQSKIRLIYEELFVFLFKVNYLKKIRNKNNENYEKNFNEKEINLFISNLPYKLTTDQLTTLEDIKNDFNSKKRMNRIVIGDVGSGKTIVAFLASYMNYLSGFQSAIMAPTEALAYQHFKNMNKLFKNTDLKIEILTGSMSKREKELIYDKVSKSEIDVLIGTHAILSNEVKFNNLGLVITDEQHRFGVNQRKTLQNKGKSPDIIYLSATPIPRTYALTIYGDMDISEIKSVPSGRQKVDTYVIKYKEVKDLLLKIEESLNHNHQTYIVSPVIENEDMLDVAKLKDKFQTAFKNVKVEIIHGKLKTQEKDRVMNDFINNKINILISTTVIEVGIDNPNANIIAIFNSERFGLSTLHQLRGRVGRSNIKSFCYLISDYDTERLNIIKNNNSGFDICEEDFKLRGHGDLFGTNQSGDMRFKIADIKINSKLMLKVDEDVKLFIERGNYLGNNLYNGVIESLFDLED